MNYARGAAADNDAWAERAARVTTESRVSSQSQESLMSCEPREVDRASGLVCSPVWMRGVITKSLDVLAELPIRNPRSAIATGLSDCVTATPSSGDLTGLSNVSGLNTFVTFEVPSNYVTVRNVIPLARLRLTLHVQ